MAGARTRPDFAPPALGGARDLNEARVWAVLVALGPEEAARRAQGCARERLT